MFLTDDKTFTAKSRALIFLSVLVAYYIFCIFGIELASINKFASPIWIASGIAIGSLTVFGVWLAPAIYIGAVLINTTTGMQLHIALVAAIGNMLEAVVASYLIIFIMKKNYFKSYSEFFSIFAGSVISSAVSATIGIIALTYDGVVTPPDFSYAWYTWWSGDAIGALIVLPVFFELFTRKEPTTITVKNIFLAVFFVFVSFGIIYLVFMKDLNQAYAWSLTPLLILSGVNLGRLYSRTLLVFLAGGIVVLTSYGYGPLEYGDKNLDFICIQSLLTSYAFAILFVRPLDTKFKISYKYALGVAAGWVILFAVIYMITVHERKYILEDYSKTTAVALDSIIRASNQYELLLNGTGALFALKDEVSREDWKIYAESLHLDSNFDAINGIGFMSNVKKKDLPGFEKKQGFKVNILDPENSKNYDDHIIVTYVEPRESNKIALGLDSGSEITRREAATKSKETHSTIATRPIVLIQDNEQRPAFLLFHPLWNLKDKFIGWAYAPVVSSLFFGKSFEKMSHLLRIKVSVEETNVFRTNESDDESFRNNNYRHSQKLIIFGLVHNIDFYPTNLFFKRHSGYSVNLALLLNLFMLLISAFLLEQLTFSQRAEAMINARTKELENSRMQLINASKMASLGEMASGLAHEINNPLAIIQGKVKVISLMFEDLNITHKPLVTEVDKIKATTERIEKIVKGLTNFSRPSQFDPFEPTSLNKIIQETLDLCSEKFKAEGISIIIHNVPNIYIACRPSQISQVLINLFNNSGDAIRDRDIKWIELSFKITGNTLSIIFTDSGPGIPVEIAEKIMEPFYTTKDANRGTGLGLSIAKSLIENHGGNLRLDSTHVNTRFILELLIKEDEELFETNC